MNYLQKTIYFGIKGACTNEEILSSALASSYELDMAAMRDIYLTKYKVTMKKDIIGDTSGSYQKYAFYSFFFQKNKDIIYGKDIIFFKHGDCGLT